VPLFSQNTYLLKGTPSRPGLLNMRNSQFNQPKDCGLGGTDTFVEWTTLNQLDSVYTQYSNYLYSSSMAIQDISHIGVCGDKIKWFEKSMNQGYDILFEKIPYKSDGSWEISGTWEGFTSGSNTSPNTSPNPNPKIKVTNAMDDTANAIRAGIINQQTYAQKMNAINTTYQNMTQTEIPHYMETRKILESNPDYDYNGTTLLYYNSQPVPTVMQQRVADADQGIAKQQSLYVLGSLTAATLLVLALILGRE
jgi:hypothetical protein